MALRAEDQALGLLLLLLLNEVHSKRQRMGPVRLMKKFERECIAKDHLGGFLKKTVGEKWGWTARSGVVVDIP